MENKKRMQIIASNITYYRKQKGITQKELAEEIGIKPSTLSDYINLRSAPSFGIIQKLADFFGIKKSDIDTTFKESENSSTSKIQQIYDQLHSLRKEKVLTFANKQLIEQNKEISDIQPEYDARKRIVGIVDFAASAGTGVWQDENLGMEVTFYEDDMAEDYDSIGIVMGHSMEPILQNGDYLFVKITSDIPNGAISIWQINGENYVKKFRNNGRPCLESLNLEYDDILLLDTDDIRPLGVVVDVYREK